MAGSFGVMYVLAGVPTAEVAKGAGARGLASPVFAGVLLPCVLGAPPAATICWPVLRFVNLLLRVPISALCALDSGKERCSLMGWGEGLPLPCP